MTARQGFWMSTYTGKRIYPLDLHPDDFDIVDIAHGLSNCCRYAGQAVSFYSVAEHCVRASTHAETPELQLEVLMHDAAEAYLGDTVKPLKEILGDLVELENQMQEIICQKFGLPWPQTKECSEIDTRMLITEAPVVFLHSDKWWLQPRYPEPYKNEWMKFGDRPRVGDNRPEPDYVPPQDDIQFWPPRMAKRLFLDRFAKLTRNAVQ